MSANMNPVTGVRYGYISANSLHPDVVHDLMWGPDAENLSLLEFNSEIAEEALSMAEAAAAELDYHMSDGEREDFIDDFVERYVERASDHWQCDEPQIEGEVDGVKYASSWLGGALNFFILESPHLARARLCSPCVPGAGNLNTLDHEGVECYDVPGDWRESL